MAQPGPQPVGHGGHPVVGPLPQVDHPERHPLGGQVGQHAQVEAGLGRLDRDLADRAVGQRGQEGVGVGLVGRHHGGVAEAEVHHGPDRQPLQGPVQHPHRVPFGPGRVVAQPRLVELDDLGARRLQGPGLGVHRLGEGQGQGLGVAVVLVHRLLAQGERPGQGHLGHPVGCGQQMAQGVQLHAPGAAHDRPDDAGHGDREPAPGPDRGRVVEVDAVEPAQQVVGVALPPHLAVGHHVDPGLLHVPDSQDRGVVLGLLAQGTGGDPPQVLGPGPGHVAGQAVPVDQPAWLGVAAHHGRGDQREGRWIRTHRATLAGAVGSDRCPR